MNNLTPIYSVSRINARFSGKDRLFWIIKLNEKEVFIISIITRFLKFYYGIIKSRIYNVILIALDPQNLNTNRYNFHKVSKISILYPLPLYMWSLFVIEFRYQLTVLESLIPNVV